MPQLTFNDFSEREMLIHTTEISDLVVVITAKVDDHIHTKLKMHKNK